MRNLNPTDPTVLENLTPSPTFQRWTLEVSLTLEIRADGLPEGVIDAPLFSRYFNTSGSSGLFIYRKVLSEIGGDTKKGWVLE